jgi:signal transduction histidine kinase
MAPTARELAILDLIVHEFQTPLSVAAGSLSQVSSGVSLTGTQQAAAERVERSVRNLSLLTDQLRGWSRVTTSGPPTPVSLAPLIAQAIAVSDAPRRDINFAPPEVPDDVQVMGVRELLEPTLVSLVAAVVRSAPSRSTVGIDIDCDPDEVRVAIGDLGVAPESEFPAEFVGGLGFALPLARAVIESAGGRIWSNADEGRISGIAIALPCA